MRGNSRSARSEAADVMGNVGQPGLLVVLSGVMLVIWGIMAIAAPGIGLLSLGTYFGIVAILSGALALYAAIRERRDLSTFGLLLLEAILLVVVGVLMLANPVATAMSIPIAVGVWAIFAGIVQGVQAYNTYEQGVKNWWVHALTGLVSIVFGYLVVTRLPAGAVAVSWLMGVAAIAVGVFRAFFGMQMNEIRRLARRRLGPAPAAETPEQRRAA